MPTYEYICRKCGHVFDEFQPITEDPLVHCPQCNTDSLARVLGGGGGVIFRGTGFYGTDYKKGKKHEGTPKEGKARPPKEGTAPTPPSTVPPSPKEEKKD